MQRLVLFDVDGTLLDTGGAGGRAVRRAMEEVYGTAGPVDDYSFAGKTDTRIARDLLSAAGVPTDTIDARADALWERYVAYLEEELGDGATRALPGIPRLLDQVEAAVERAVLGLLTGNIPGGARAKLSAAQIEFDRFRVGAYGSDHADRARLPAVAVHRAFRSTGRRFERKEIVIVGDTPADISCGESLGVKTVAVATGSYTRAQLAEHRPDHLFDSFEEVDAALEAILA
jgi:phosphoglycolate phosphatase